MFGYPKTDTKTFADVVCFLDDNRAVAIGVLPWFTAEIIHHFGSQSALEFLQKWGSRRVPIKVVLKDLDGDEKFRKVVQQNCIEGEYVEVQSASSFWNGLRTIKLKAECKNLSPSEAATATGLSLRTVQRYMRGPEAPGSTYTRKPPSISVSRSQRNRLQASAK